MGVKLQPRKEIHALTVSASDNSFGLDVTPFFFENCREKFGKMWDQETPGFFFKHPEGTGRNIVAFIIKTERILKKRRSKFAETNWTTILWIEPSKFWKS